MNADKIIIEYTSDDALFLRLQKFRVPGYTVDPGIPMLFVLELTSKETCFIGR